MSAQVVNRVTGECVVTDEKTGRTYNLEFDIKAITKLEQMCAGKSAMTLIATPPSMTDMACMLVMGVEGWNRRNGAAQKPLNPNLAQQLIVNAGGYARIVDELQLSLARGEGMGLLDGAEEDAMEAGTQEGEGADAARPTGASPTP